MLTFVLSLEDPEIMQTVSLHKLHVLRTFV